MTIDTVPVSGGSDRQIETGRLVLRMFGMQDFEPLSEITRDPETFRFSERGPMGKDEAWTRMLRNIGHWQVNGYGIFAVEEQQSGRLVGEAGLANFRRCLGARFDEAPEATWTIAPWAQGRGYATEAVDAALAWIEAKLGPPRTVCLIHLHHASSLRVAEKTGYRPFEECKYKGYPALLLERMSGASRPEKSATEGSPEKEPDHPAAQ